MELMKVNYKSFGCYSPTVDMVNLCIEKVVELHEISSKFLLIHVFASIFPHRSSNQAPFSTAKKILALMLWCSKEQFEEIAMFTKLLSTVLLTL